MYLQQAMDLKNSRDDVIGIEKADDQNHHTHDGYVVVVMVDGEEVRHDHNNTAEW